MYYEQIDPQGEDSYQECAHCGVTKVTYKCYCSRECYNYDNY